MAKSSHVAPSYKDHETTNTLMIRPRYRITLRLGDIDSLFPWPIDDPTGRMARLQVLGLFNWPLNHRVAAGKGMWPRNPDNSRKPRFAHNQDALNFTWKEFKETHCGHEKIRLGGFSNHIVALGEGQVGKSKKVTAFFLVNRAKRAVSITSLTLGGTHAAQFRIEVKNDGGQAVDASGQFRIAAGRTFTVKAVFTPQGAAGAREAEISLATRHRPAGGVAFKLGLNATATTGAPAAGVPGPVTVDVGAPGTPHVRMPTTQRGKKSAKRIFTLENLSAADVEVTALQRPAVNSEFKLKVRNASGAEVAGGAFTLAAGALHTLEVILSPTSRGNKSETITFTATGQGNVVRNYTLAMNGRARNAVVADGVNDTIGENEIKKRLKEWIVFRTDGTANGGAGGRLPLPAPENDAGDPIPDETQGHFAKMRLPGGWCFLAPGASGHDYNKDATITGMEMGQSVYAFEGACYKQNPVLGKIPLVAKVEKKSAKGDGWVPAKRAWVHFQLLKPYDLPNFDANRPPNRQLNRPDLIGTAYHVSHPPPDVNADGGPEYFRNYWVNTRFPVHADNPQVNNCHEDCGGKRKAGNQDDGSDVNDILFKLGKVKGFSIAHGYTPAKMLPSPPVKRKQVNKLFESVAGTGSADHPHAVKTQTNEDGEAGVIFMPSRCAGDRYRIRAYVAPSTVTGAGSDGKGAMGVRADTGTFVIWRTLRMSRWFKQDLTNARDIPDVLTTQLLDDLGEAVANPPSHDNKISVANKFDADANVANPNKGQIGLPVPDWDTVSNGQQGSNFDGLKTSFARAFCEFETDPGFEIKPLDNDTWNAALNLAIGDGRVIGKPTLGGNALHINLTRLFFRDDNTITVANGFAFPARTPAAYDAATGTNHLTGPTAADHIYQVYRLFNNYLFQGFMRYLSNNGYLPGITVFQCITLCNLESSSDATLQAMGALGWGAHYNCAFMGGGTGAYPTTIAGAGGDYSYTATALHEFGHIVFKRHAPPTTDVQASVPPPSIAHSVDPHDGKNLSENAATIRPVPRLGICVMSYRACEGMLCARCLFALRGWNIWANRMKDAPEPGPGP